MRTGLLVRDWFQRRDRILRELALLRDAGFEVDAPEVPERGSYSISVWLPIEGVKQVVRAVFPDLYPYFRFEVFADELDLRHHQNPVQKNLCLLGRQTEFLPGSDTLLDFLSDRLPRLVNAARSSSPQEVEEVEDHQAEPITEYYRFSRGILLIDEGWSFPSDPWGRLDIGYLPGSEAPFERVLATAIKTKDGQVLDRVSPEVARPFNKPLPGFWVRLQRHQPKLGPGEFLDQIRKIDEQLVPVDRKRRGAKGNQHFYLIIAPEESGWRELSDDGWVGLTTIPVGKKIEVRFVRVGRIGAEAWGVRIPELKPLRKKTVVVFGLGSLGAPLALSLAQAGVRELRIVDHDWVDPGTIVRWPRGLIAAGLGKADAIKHEVERHYPWCKVQEHVRRIGAWSNDDDFASLTSIVDNADLMIDATAEPAVQYFLSHLALHYTIPYLAVEGRSGGWGGQIVRLLPSTEGCLSCLRALRSEGKLTKPHLSDAAIQPQGCADVTFTAAGFDMSFLALSAARAAAEVLSEGYPKADWDVLTIQLRAKDGGPAVPQFVAERLTKYPGCEVCGRWRQRSG